MNSPQDFVVLTMDATRDALTRCIDQLRALQRAGANVEEELELAWNAFNAFAKYYAKERGKGE